MSGYFVHLNVHTEYSLTDGILRISDLVETAKNMGMPAIAITEHNNLFSTVKFYRAAETQGIKPVIGAEIRVIDNNVSDKQSRLTLLCQNLQGYHNLTQLITKSYTKGKSHGWAQINKSWLASHTEGLIILSGGMSGDIGQALLANNIDYARQLVEDWQALAPDRFYIEITRTGRQMEEQYLIAVVGLAEKFNLPVVATNDVRFLSEEDYEAHETRFCIQHGYTLNDPRRPRQFSQKQYFRSSDEMNNLFQDIPEAIENTVAIAQRCNLEFRLGDNFLPYFPVPDNYTQDEWLKHKVVEGLENRIREGYISREKHAEYHDRLEKELKVIIEMGFPGYFLIVSDFIQWAKSRGIPVGPGRGSGSGSLVAYALEITELDPLQYDLLFERFLNPERVSLPDFDVDFCMERRDEVIEYVAQRYGRDHVSQIITHGSMAAKAVVRDVGRVLGYPYGFVDQIAKLIPFELNMTLDRALEEESILKQRYQEEEEVNTLINLAKKLEGLTRNAGRHAGGIVIAPESLTNYMPLYCEQGATTTVTQFDMGDVEAIGLVKFDFLGLRTLTIINYTVKDANKALEQQGQTKINIATVSLNDEMAYELIRRTDTTAIFQLESDGMKKLIKRLQPDNFNDLIALVALFRPGPLQSGMVDDYIERKHGRSEVRFIHPKLEDILRPTHGVIIYQEQVMQIAQELAGYTLGAADLLRRAMGKKKPEEMAAQREIFTSGAVTNGIGLKMANYIFDLMEKFAEYGFNKSHSTAYALIAYQTAWLKAHYPAAFMAAVLSSDMDNTDKVVMLLDELNRMQIKLELPHVNKSLYRFTIADEKSINYGLGAIKGVGKSAIDNILFERTQNGDFIDLFDLCRRIDTRKANKRVLEALIKSGAMDGLGPNRSSLFASLGTAMQLAEQYNHNTISGQDDMFGLDNYSSGTSNKDTEGKFNVIPDWDENKRLAGEKETLGFYLKGHPINQYENELNKFISCKLKNLRPGNVIVAGFIHRLRTRSGTRGRMAEIILDDRTARANVSVYSEKFQHYRNLLVKDELVIIMGDVIADEYLESGYSIIAKEIYDIEQIRNKFAFLNIKLSPEQANRNTIIMIQKILASHSSGNCRINVYYHNENASCNLEIGKKWKVLASDNLLQSLKNTLGTDNVSIEYNI
jgi:DNA polymerase III subunit alpha